MTKIGINTNSDRCVIFMSGHAGYDLNGNDIVCHGLSMLGQTLVVALRDAQDNGIIRKLEETIEDGYLEVSYIPIEHPVADAILETIVTGYRLVEANYPDYCEIRMTRGEKSVI